MNLEAKALEEYNKRRPEHARGVPCHAPFTALNFEQGGNVTACCYNRTFVLGKYPENSLKDIWFGTKAEELREYIAQNDFSHGCDLCARQINSFNFEGSRAKGFDHYAKKERKPSFFKQLKGAFGIKEKVYPKVLEFEIDNTCNLECVMCNGKFSSLIRKNRENLPPIPNPYDEEFVKQIKPFLPYLDEAKFLGGEPFLTPLFYKIWDAIAEINPNIKVSITTNGTVLTNKVKEVLEKLHVKLTLSIDAISKEYYEKIRINANYEKVMENLNFFQNYSKETGYHFSFTSCPMTNNWQDIPNLLKYALKLDIPLFYNTVLDPKELSFSSLKYWELKKVIETYESFQFPESGKNLQKNIHGFNDLINFLKTILNDRMESIKLFEEFKIYLNEQSLNIKQLATIYLAAQEYVTGEGEFKAENISILDIETDFKKCISENGLEEITTQIVELILNFSKQKLKNESYENAKQVLMGLKQFAKTDNENAFKVLFGIMKTEIRYVLGGISTTSPDKVGDLIFSEYVSGIYHA